MKTTNNQNGASKTHKTSGKSHQHHQLNKSVKSKSSKHPEHSASKASPEKTQPDHEQQSAKTPTSKRAALGDALFSMRTFNADVDLPLVYNEQYNIRLMGLELTHRCDTKRFEKLAHQLNVLFLDTPHSRHRLVNDEHTVSREEDIADSRRLRYLTPNRPVNLQELRLHHTSDYVRQLHEDKRLISRISETWFINVIPMCVIETRLLTPVKLQTAGTIFATHLAMQHGWSINLGGGFHAAFADYGETFCFISDVLLAIKYVWRRHPLQKFMIIDLDAHQATGIERDLVDLPPKRRQSVFMLDVFNSTIQPADAKADQGIDLRVELPRFVGDETYLKQLDTALANALSAFKPSLVFYIAGQDILQSDPLGLMNISDGGLIKRDELVFSHVSERNKCPIVMLLGGGYLARGIRVQAGSIRNLFAKGLIWAGHRSGSRTLTRPRFGKTEKTDPTTSASREHTATASNEPTTMLLKTIQTTTQTAEKSMAPEVNAISQSVSTSGGARRMQVVRLSKTVEKSHKSSSKKAAAASLSGSKGKKATPQTATEPGKQSSKSSKKPHSKSHHGSGGKAA